MPISLNLRRLLLAGFVALAAAAPALEPAFAQQRGEGSRNEAASGPGVLSLLPADSVTEHRMERGADSFAYHATAGAFDLFDQTGAPSAKIVYFAYTRDGSEAGSRPVTFVFNGGPGAASAYLHLGVVGPKAAEFSGPNASGLLVDNPDTWLRFTDLVMIDPVGTGWSRAANPDKASDFWGVDADAQTIAKVIALYLAKNGRMASPKYLLGESYGGFRSVEVASVLQRDQGVLVDGLVMLSPFLEGALNFGATRFPFGAALQLPSLAAAELDRSGRFSDEALASAERFAFGDYLTTLAGPPPQGEAAETFYRRIAAFTGLPVETVARTRGFIGDAYGKRGGAASAIFSPYDAAVAEPDPFPESAADRGPDPILDGYTRGLGGLFVAYARDTLGFRTDMSFTLLSRDAFRSWNWGDSRSLGGASAIDDLRALLALNPALRVLVAHGRSDVVTPYAVSRYLLDRLPPIGAPDRTALHVYRGGHMFYFDPAARAAFAADAAGFYAAARPPGR
ncbi:S10 family peptidase [Prosthecomicrobium pneumaticum]|uniref:Carboxypeptidase C (Cathepsin A) n=1 Tax=Prosthecomicrobium pneumaticum TaxID=81895 RepID=A0A7W9CVM9_9HYPH|nr:carboxypeptidase [Prosthecomicrobium pneumaticum]MBB5752723.1 carboxypeptidase C (cathepsin A) [Prosthecomicrobium pneumaticum]